MITTRALWLFAAALLPLCTTCAPPAQTAPSKARHPLAYRISREVGVYDSVTLIMRYPPPPLYTLWRLEVEACSGVQRDGEPSFWVAQHLPINGAGALGMYVRSGRKILIALGHEFVDYVIRHEYLHDLLNVPFGQEQHPRLYFVEQCGHLVYPVKRGPSS